ncbi:MAG: hypothetical protein GY746_01530 [Gammaproteobacteria bacterium]|nr:hypothetical protein [Gammaproteobacteria bacterium]MCP4801179.1 hypothetical protein [bacterium]
MKTFFVLLILICTLFAVTALADSPIFSNDQPGQVPSPDNVSYCQPLNPYFSVHNASTGFSSEVADDIPAELTGQIIYEVSIYVGEFYGWIDPSGVVLNFYNDECPPNLDPDQTFYFAWDDIEKELVYNSSWRVYLVTLILPEPVLILDQMSMGAYMDNDWGEAEPLCGVGVTDYDDTYGCGESYIDAEYWGYIRWTGSGELVGTYFDLAYCLSTGPAANEDKSWGSLKAMFR